MKEYNTKLTFKQVMAYFIPAIALIALLIVSNNAISAGGSLSVFGVIALVFNVIVLGKYVIDNAKKDKSTKSE